MLFAVIYRVSSLTILLACILLLCQPPVAKSYESYALDLFCLVITLTKFRFAYDIVHIFWKTQNARYGLERLNYHHLEPVNHCNSVYLFRLLLPKLLRWSLTFHVHVILIYSSIHASQSFPFTFNYLFIRWTRGSWHLSIFILL